MVFGGSTASFDSSFVGALYGEKDDDDDGCCSRCCQRYPWPSITSGIFVIGGIVTWCTTVIMASRETIDLFKGTVAEDELDQMFSLAQYATYGSTAFMVILGLVLISIGCLATGAVRRYHICRFRHRGSAIFQTTTFLIITYIVLLGWLGILIVSMFPLVFFTVQKQGNCQVDVYTLNTCIDLEEWGFVDENEKGLDTEFCKDELERLCEGNLRLLFFMATMSAVLICIGLAQFLATLAYNAAKLRHCYTSHNRGKSGSYNLRASYRAGSFRSTRNQYKASRESITQPKARSNSALYQSEDSIDRLKKEYASREYTQSRERGLADNYSHHGSREWENQGNPGKGSHEPSTISTYYGVGGDSASTMRYEGDSHDGRYTTNDYQSSQYQREYHV